MLLPLSRMFIHSGFSIMSFMYELFLSGVSRCLGDYECCWLEPFQWNNDYLRESSSISRRFRNRKEVLLNDFLPCLCFSDYFCTLCKDIVHIVVSGSLFWCIRNGCAQGELGLSPFRGHTTTYLIRADRHIAEVAPQSLFLDQV